MQAIIREFERTPPPLASEQRINDPISPIGSKRGNIYNLLLIKLKCLYSDSDNMGRISPNYPSNYLNRQSFSPPQATSVFQTSTFPGLNTCSLEDLEFLNESEERRGEFLENLQQTQDINKTLDDMISLVEELAGEL